MGAEHVPASHPLVPLVAGVFLANPANVFLVVIEGGVLDVVHLLLERPFPLGDMNARVRTPQQRLSVLCLLTRSPWHRMLRWGCIPMPRWDAVRVDEVVDTLPPIKTTVQAISCYAEAQRINESVPPQIGRLRRFVRTQSPTDKTTPEIVWHLGEAG